MASAEDPDPKVALTLTVTLVLFSACLPPALSPLPLNLPLLYPTLTPTPTPRCAMPASPAWRSLVRWPSPEGRGRLMRTARCWRSRIPSLGPLFIESLYK